jgi:hypothetical protein
MKTQNSNQNISTKTDLLINVKARQIIWADWMQEATKGLTEAHRVEVTTHHTPFGNYVIGIKPVTE